MPQDERGERTAQVAHKEHEDIRCFHVCAELILGYLSARLREPRLGRGAQFSNEALSPAERLQQLVALIGTRVKVGGVEQVKEGVAHLKFSSVSQSASFTMSSLTLSMLLWERESVRKEENWEIWPSSLM